MATPEEIHLGRSGFYFLGNMKFLLYHIIPGSYEHWNLSPETMTYARRFRVAVALGISLQVGIVMYLLLTLV